MQWSKFKRVMTKTATAEMARSGWILGLLEGREEVERNVKAEKRRCPG